MVVCFIIPSLAHEYKALEIIPVGRAVARTVQHILGYSDIPAVYVGFHLVEKITSAAAPSTSTAVTVRASSAVRTAGAGREVFHKMIICFIDLSEFLFSQFRLGIVPILIRMIFFDQFPVCFFYFILAGTFSYPEDFIRILQFRRISLFPECFLFF